MLNQNSTIPLYEQVKEAIKLKIEQKEWKENTRVPSETELMKIYEVSRVTVRNALALLVDEGYLEKKQGIGTFVSKPRIKKIICLYFTSKFFNIIICNKNIIII